jgi:hypothetical protein
MIIGVTKPFCCSHEVILKPAPASTTLCEGVQNLVTDGTVARGWRVIWQVSYGYT